MKNTKINININKKILTTALLVAIFSIFVSEYSAEAKEINLANTVNLTNQDRIKNGLRELLINPTLNKVAAKKAQHMIKYHYFSHTSPEGINPWYWFKDEGYDYKYAGENLAINYSSAESQQSAWMKSATHRKNILNPKYREIGIATTSGYINNKPASITVQVFGTPQKPINTTAFLSSNQKMSQTSISIPYVLGEQIKYPIQTHYLSKSNNLKPSAPKNTSLPISIHLLNTIKKQSHNLLWVTILILCILIIRDIVLRSIASPAMHKPSITNLILLIMLWSVFTGM